MFWLAAFAAIALLGACASTDATFGYIGDTRFEWEGDFAWVLQDNGNDATIVGYRGASTGVTIPSQIQEKPVTYIHWFGTIAYVSASYPGDRNAGFKYKSRADRGLPLLTSVIIPDSVIRIGSLAFANNRLTGVIIPDSVTRIGDKAFANNQITGITLPDSITELGSQVFANNPLTDVTMPDNVAALPSAGTDKQGNDGSGAFANTPYGRQIQKELEAQQQAERERAEQERLARLYRQAGNNQGNLRNTSWSSSIVISEILVERRIDFGDGNFVGQGTFLTGRLGTTRGTFRVSGDTVIFLIDGDYDSGTLTGNTLKLTTLGAVLRRL